MTAADLPPDDSRRCHRQASALLRHQSDRRRGVGCPRSRGRRHGIHHQAGAGQARHRGACAPTRWPKAERSPSRCSAKSSLPTSAWSLLTGFNPNVFYELAVAQSAARPVVILIEKGLDAALRRQGSAVHPVRNGAGLPSGQGRLRRTRGRDARRDQEDRLEGAESLRAFRRHAQARRRAAGAAPAGAGATRDSAVRSGQAVCAAGRSAARDLPPDRRHDGDPEPALRRGCRGQSREHGPAAWALLRRRFDLGRAALPGRGTIGRRPDRSRLPRSGAATGHQGAGHRAADGARPRDRQRAPPGSIGNTASSTSSMPPRCRDRSATVTR